MLRNGLYAPNATSPALQSHSAHTTVVSPQRISGGDESITPDALLPPMQMDHMDRLDEEPNKKRRYTRERVQLHTPRDSCSPQLSIPDLQYSQEELLHLREQNQQLKAWNQDLIEENQRLREQNERAQYKASQEYQAKLDVIKNIVRSNAVLEAAVDVREAKMRVGLSNL